MEPRFIVDLNVGRLGKWLRVLGFDTAFWPGAEDRELVRAALREGRVVLTKDTLLMRRRVVTSGQLRAILIQGDDVRGQLRQVVEVLKLDSGRRFSRCIRCNVVLVPVPREAVQPRVPPYVFQTQREFNQCPLCQRVYWRGTHWANMRAALSELEVG